MQPSHPQKGNSGKNTIDLRPAHVKDKLSPRGREPRAFMNLFRMRKYSFYLSKKILAVILTALAIALLMLTWALTRAHKPMTENGLPKSIRSSVTSFKLYYPRAESQIGFKYVKNTANYQGGILVFELENSVGKTLAVTEEATPPNFDYSALNADKQYANQYGQAYISDLLDRTTGALFTSDQTWILINAPTPIGADAMEQILDNLSPQ